MNWRSPAFSRPISGAARAFFQRSHRSGPRNFIIVFADDLGYADIGSFSTLKGDVRPVTPNLDRMAEEGIRLTNFYAAQAVCSASRAALLTGTYPNRIGILGALRPTATDGINADEMTIAEDLKRRGYATAIFGKVAPRPPEAVPPSAAWL